MKTFAIYTYWVFTIITHIIFLTVIFRNTPYENYDPILIVFGIVTMIFSWILIMNSISTFKTNDKIERAWVRLKEMESDCKKREEAVNLLASKKLGVSEEDIKEEMKNIK